MVFKLTEVVKTFIAVVNHLQGSNNFTEKLGISGMYRKYKHFSTSEKSIFEDAPAWQLKSGDIPTYETSKAT